MCGIAAVWGAGTPGLAATIAGRMAHRGPDGEGSAHFGESRLALAHRRLSIIDPQGGRQPLVSGDRGGALIANGMIYNDVALRNSLGESRFTTASDSESILRSCLRDGSQAVSGLDGMFAFVMARGDKLIAARDPIGIKPLYVGRRGGAFYFASEIKALLPDADEIHEFPPGCVFDSALGLHRYYTLPGATDELCDANAAAAAIRRTLTLAVEKRLRSDVPLGVFLSGGLDSSVVAALASQSRPGLKSFSVGLPGSPDLEAARRVATHLGTDHHEYQLSREEVMRDLPRILQHLESFDQELVRSAVPCYYVSRLAAQHVKVVLTGEGADELFAGYAYHKLYRDMDALQAELRRSVLSMHDINLQRVDRMTMAHGLEARVPFLDLDLLDLAFRIPATLKLPADTGTEKWILRKAFEDLLPADIVWRDKVQFDEGTGIGAWLQADPATKAPASLHSDLPGVARSDEESFYRSLLIEQVDEPDSLLELVAHWDDERRIEDGPGRVRAAVTPLDQRTKASRANDGAVLGDFSALYDQASPRPYFRRMAELDYQVPAAASEILGWCIDELRRIENGRELNVLDLCAGYGINGALMKLDLSLDELYRYFDKQPDTGNASGFFDRLCLADHRKKRDVNVIGLDVASNALEYARAAGFINDLHAVDLENRSMTPRLGAALAQCSLISVTGGFSFIGAATFRKILSALPRSPADKPWIVGFPLLHTDLEPLLKLLASHGYVVSHGADRNGQHRFLQRQFANARECEGEHRALARARLEPSAKHYFESRLLIAQPAGMPPVPADVLANACERHSNPLPGIEKIPAYGANPVKNFSGPNRTQFATS